MRLTTATFTILHDTFYEESAPGFLTDDGDLDLDPITPTLVNDVQHGTLTFNSDGSFRYEPDAQYVGLDQFTYKVNDTFLDSDIATVSFEVYNTAPYAGDNGTFTLLHDTFYEEPAPGFLTDDGDLDGDPITPRVIDDVQHGTLTFNTDGSFRYEPDEHYVGLDQFTYKVNDTFLDSDLATVSFEVYNTAPYANDDGEYTVVNTASLTIEEPGLLENDGDSDGDEITAVKTVNPAHGSVTVNSDGSFTYTPHAGYVGYDTFKYKSFDGIEYSDEATVTVRVLYEIFAATDVSQTDDALTIEEQLFQACTCGCDCYVGTADDVQLTYNSASASPQAVLMSDVQVSADDGFDDTLSVQFSINGTPYNTLYYDLNTLEDVELRITEQFDLSALPTGQYDYSVTFASEWLDPESEHTFAGSLMVVNDSNSPLGAGWNVGGIRRVHPDGTGGALVTKGDGTGHVYGGAQPNGTFGQYTETSTGSSLTDRWGKTFHFDSAGLMTSRVERTGEITTYAYIDGDSDGDADDLSEIVDSAGRTVTFTYASGKLQSVEDFAGRVETLSISGSLDSITHPDPDGAGPLAAPVVSFAYSGAALASVTQPGGGVTDFTYHGGRLAQTDAPDGSSTQLYSVQTHYGYGSYDDAAPAALTMTRDVWGSVTDAQGRVTEFTPDRFGNWTTSIDALGFTTLYERDENGLLLSQTDPDPDGAGPLSSPVTTHQYDGRGNRTQTTLPDSTTRLWTYHTVWNVPLSYVDELSQLTLYTVDSATGNVLTERLVVGQIDDAFNLETNDLVTTNTYTPAPTGTNDPPVGLLASTTQPDPDGAGPLAAPVTSYAYDRYGRLITHTNPDLTTRTFTYDAADNLLTETDELGRVTTYTYDLLNRQTQVSGPDPDGAGPLSAPLTTYAYDLDNNLVEQTEPGDRVTLWVYNSKGQLTSQTDPDPDGVGSASPPVTSSTYTLTGDLLTETDALGRVTTYAYNDGFLQSITLPDPDGVGPLAAPVTSYTYEAAGRMLTETNALGGVTTYVYDRLGRILSVTQPDPDGAGSQTRPITSYTYDTLGRVLTETDPLGRVTASTYDDLGRLLTLTQPDPDGAGPLTAPVTSQTYNRLGNIVTATDALGNVTAHAYDKLGRNTSITLPDPDGAGPLAAPVTTISYDVMSRMTSQTDALLRQTDYAYDDAGQLIEQIDPRGTTTFEFDALGRLVLIVEPDPDGMGPLNAPETENVYDNRGFLVSVVSLLGVTDYTLDHLGRQVSVTLPDPDGAGSQTRPVHSATYNALGQVLTETDPLGRVTTHQYDALGRLTKRIDPDPDGGGSQVSPETQYAYNAAGQLTSETNPLGKTTAYAHDGLGRRTSITDPENGVTSFTFDAVGNQLTLTDPVGNISGWYYDNLNRVKYEVNDLTHLREFQYNAVGNLIERNDRSGRSVVFVYDNLHRQTQEKWLDGQTLRRTITSQYDAVGKLLSISDPDSTLKYSYDTYDRVSLIDNNGTANVPRVRLAQAYDEYSRRTSLTATVATTADFKNTYQFDNLSRVTRIQQGSQSGGHAVAAKRIDLSYNAASQFDGLKRYADTAGTKLVAESDYVYDQLGRLTTLTHFQGATVFADYDWTFDAFSRVTTFTSSADGVSNYSYDDTNQLTTADHNYQTDESYTFDANGNRTMSGYSTSDNNRLDSDGTFNYYYDSEGNRFSRARISTASANDYTTDYTWDHRNRLTEVTFRNNNYTIAKSVKYAYDVFDRRISKAVDNNGDGTYERGERYVYDGEHIALVFDHTGALLHRYTHNPNNTDQVFSDEQFDPTSAGQMPSAPGDVIWPLPDNLGTNRDLAEYDDATGITAIANHRVFDSFGKMVSETDPTVDHAFDYTSRELDPDTGLMFYRARWYDPAVGRFISEDPISFAGGDANLARYIGNNTLNGTDPSGNQVRPVHGAPPGDPSQRTLNEIDSNGNASLTVRGTREIDRALNIRREIVGGQMIGAICTGVAVVLEEIIAELATAGVAKKADLVFDVAQSGYLWWRQSRLVVKAGKTTHSVPVELVRKLQDAEVAAGQKPSSLPEIAKALNEKLKCILSKPEVFSEQIGGFSVLGNRRIVETVFETRITMFSGKATPENVRRFAKTLEDQARARGADTVRIIGHGVSDNVLRPTLASKLGYETRRIDQNTIEYIKKL